MVINFTILWVASNGLAPESSSLHFTTASIGFRRIRHQLTTASRVSEDLGTNWPRFRQLLLDQLCWGKCRAITDFREGPFLSKKVLSGSLAISTKVSPPSLHGLVTHCYKKVHFTWLGLFWNSRFPTLEEFWKRPKNNLLLHH